VKLRILLYLPKLFRRLLLSGIQKDRHGISESITNRRIFTGIDNSEDPKTQTPGTANTEPVSSTKRSSL
jgi:hypothetical protein